MVDGAGRSSGIEAGESCEEIACKFARFDWLSAIGVTLFYESLLSRTRSSLSCLKIRVDSLAIDVCEVLTQKPASE